MCTSLTLPTPDGRRLFGRTLDLDTHFGERVVLTPRRYPFLFGDGTAQSLHHALLGMAAVEGGYPLYAEAMNERGLCMAGLRFAGNARYADRAAVGKVNLAPWELIPHLLGNYTTVNEVRNALREIRVVDRPFIASSSEVYPAAPLHWHIADACPAHGELVVEITTDGMRVFENPVGVLTNNPPFPYQLMCYAELARLTAWPQTAGGRGTLHQGNTNSAANLTAKLADILNADPFSLGEGGLGMPGDYSSPSRFVRAATLRRWVLEWMRMQHAGGESSDNGAEVTPVAQFFRILSAVSPMAGAVLTDKGKAHRTLYTCCMDGGAGVYHCFTEEDTAVRSVSFAGAECEGDAAVAL